MSALIIIDSIKYFLKSEEKSTLKLGNGEDVDRNGYADDLPKRVVIPETIFTNNKTYKVTEITHRSLRNSTKLTYLYIASTIETIYSQSIDQCPNLEKIEFGENSVLKEIMIGGIWNTKVKVLNFPASLSNIEVRDGYSAFGSNKNLRHVYHCGSCYFPDAAFPNIPRIVIIHVKSDYQTYEATKFRFDTSSGCIPPNKIYCTYKIKRRILLRELFIAIFML